MPFAFSGHSMGAMVGFSLHMLPGDHFFLHSSQIALLEIVTRELEGAAARLS
jgi:surfactin synthase thioesterase subunit